MQININPGPVLKLLAALIVLFALAHVAGLISTFVFGRNEVLGLVPLFNMDLEENAPTWFSSCILAISALLLCAIAKVNRARGEDWRLWALLSAIFVLLSLDEVAQIHEQIGTLFSAAGGLEGATRAYAWLIPYSVVVVVLGLAYLRFVLRLPTTIRNLMILSGGLYILGAMGIELFGSLFWDANHQDWRYWAVLTVEETVEMSGISLFIYTLLSHMQTLDMGITFKST